MELRTDDDAFAGDPAWKVVRALPDGTPITIRPICPDDREALKRGFQEASAQTRYLRFLGVVGELSEEALTYLTTVDQHDHIALVATMTTPDLKVERGVGVARLIRMKDSAHVAEAAITVVDDLQQRGIGTVLAHELARAAQARGIRVIRADVLEGNSAMRAILEGAGAKRIDTGDPTGTLSYDIQLEAAPTRAWVVELLRGAAQTMAMSIRKLVPPDHKDESPSK